MLRAVWYVASVHTESLAERLASARLACSLPATHSQQAMRPAPPWQPATMFEARSQQASAAYLDEWIVQASRRLLLALKSYAASQMLHDTEY